MSIVCERHLTPASVRRRRNPYWRNFASAGGVTSFAGAMVGFEVDTYGALHPYASLGEP